jgi:hypothetical protein
LLENGKTKSRTQERHTKNRRARRWHTQQDHRVSQGGTYIHLDGLGGTDALTTWGKANPTQFYALWAKLLPQEVSAKVDTSVSVEVVGHGFDGLRALMQSRLEEIEKNKTRPKRLDTTAL